MIERQTGILGIICLAIVGCAIDQKKEIAIYREVIDLEAPEYESGKPLSLRQALLLANQNNETLAVQGEDYLQALISRRRAVAEFLPTIDLVGTYDRRDPTGGGVTVDDDPDEGDRQSNDEQFDVSADLQWNVFNGFRDINRYWRDTYSARQRRNDLLDVQESLLLDVAQVYYQILRAQSLTRVLESSLAVQEERVRSTRGRRQAGFSRPLDVAQTEAQAAQTRTTLIDARRDAANARALLVLLTAAPVNEAPLADAYALPAEVQPLEHYVRSAEQSRPDLLAAEAAVLAARRDVEVAFGQYYPTVSLNFSAFLYRESVPEERDWDGLLIASIPIFSGGRIETDVRAAWSFFRQALLLRSFLTRQVDQQVRDAHQALAASEARVESLQAQLSAAEQAFRLSEASYRAGLGTNLERVAAQDALLEAQLRLASEEYDRKVLYLALLRVSGLLRRELQGMPPSNDAMDMLQSPTTAPVEGFKLSPATRPTTLPEAASGGLGLPPIDEMHGPDIHAASGELHA